MTCTAKCLGDNACITGCFAKYGNEPMNDLLECSIEKNACIKVAILPPGPDSAKTAPAPPLAPVADFKPRSLEGTWYKVMGWNDRYDCFDCQCNSFEKPGAREMAATRRASDHAISGGGGSERGCFITFSLDGLQPLKTSSAHRCTTV